MASWTHTAQSTVSPRLPLIRQSICYLCNWLDAYDIVSMTSTVCKTDILHAAPQHTFSVRLMYSEGFPGTWTTTG